LIPAVKVRAKALSMGSFPKSAPMFHWLFALAEFSPKTKSFTDLYIVHFDRRKCLNIEGYLMEGAAKEKQLHKYPARTSPHRTMKP